MASHFCGSRNSGWSDGTRLTSAMENPLAVCADPRNPTGYYIADQASIRYFDEAKDRITIFASSGDDDWFINELCALIVSSCGSTIWYSDCSGIHRIETTTRERSTVFSDDLPGWMCWDRSPHIKHDSAFYFDAAGVEGQFNRFDTSTVATAGNRERGPTLKSQPPVKQVYSFRELDDCLTDAVCTQSGHLLFAVQAIRSCLYAFDPITSNLERIKSIATNGCSRLLLLDSTRTLITVDLSVITTFTLPPEYFAVQRCCERDL